MPKELSLVIFRRVYFATFIEHLFPNRDLYTRTRAGSSSGPRALYKSPRTKRGEAHGAWMKQQIECFFFSVRNPQRAAVKLMKAPVFVVFHWSLLALLQSASCENQAHIWDCSHSTAEDVCVLFFFSLSLFFHGRGPSFFQFDPSQVGPNRCSVEAQNNNVFCFVCLFVCFLAPAKCTRAVLWSYLPTVLLW